MKTYIVKVIDSDYSVEQEGSKYNIKNKEGKVIITSSDKNKAMNNLNNLSQGKPIEDDESSLNYEDIDNWLPEEHYQEMNMMNLIIQSMNNEEAYYNNWVYLWPDESKAEDGYFDDEDDYYELKNFFKSIYRKFHDDGLYTPSIEVEAEAHEWDKKLGLEPIINYHKR